MAIDIVFVIVLVLLILIGLRKGFISSLFSLCAVVIGVLAAVHLSELVAIYSKQYFNITSKFIPLIAFSVVFLIVGIAFWVASKMIERVFSVLHINFINKIAGALLFCISWTMLYSTILFYGNNANLFSAKLKNESLTYSKIADFAPQTAELIGELLPPIKNIFNSLNEWFKQLEQNNTPST